MSEFLIRADSFDMLNTRNTDGLNPFLSAVSRGAIDQLTYFIDKDSSILRSVDANKNNALHRSTRAGTIKVSEYLIGNHSYDKFNTKNTDGLNQSAIWYLFGTGYDSSTVTAKRQQMIKYRGQQSSYSMIQLEYKSRTVERHNFCF